MIWIAKGRTRRPLRGHVFRSIILIVWVSILCLWVYMRRRPRLSYMGEDTFKYIIGRIYSKNPLVNSKGIQSSGYDQWLKEFDVGDVVRNADFHERCDAYFERLYKQEEKNIINPHRGFTFDRDMFKPFEEFREGRINRWKEKKKKEAEKAKAAKKEKEAEKDKQQNKDKKKNKRDNTGEQSKPEEFEPDEKVEQDIKNEYKKGWDTIRTDEQVLHDYLSHVRIFNKCFVTFESNEDNEKNGKFIEYQSSFTKRFRSSESKIVQTRKDAKKTVEEFPTCDELQKKVFPWLTGKFPEFEKWDGSKYEFPVFTKKVTDVKKYKTTSKFTQKGHCFLNEYRRRINGKGIVLTISDGHLDLTIRLIRLLRSLQNELPIQIVYYSDFSDETKKQLVAASSSKFENYPTQDLWFVNANNALHKDYKNKFGGFGNKILATMFNSFEEMVLIDADTVLLENPEFFFSLPKYKRTGTMFYKDRSTVEFRPKSDLNFFHKLMPSQLDTMLFNIPQVTNHSLETSFFKGLNHYMESGLVVINRGIHFAQAIMMSELNFHLSIQARVYGDKELFWLALVLSGDENFAFNEHFAAAIGFSTPQQERMLDAKRAKTFNSLEICSNHPAHINDEDSKSLLWFNSGFRHCGRYQDVNFPAEYKVRRRYTDIESLKEFETFFKDKIIIKEAIIPPSRAYEAKNVDGEPDRSWINLREYCNGYTWCAYSQIGGNFKNEETGKTESNVEEGIYIQFTDDQIEKFNRLGTVWTSSFDYRSQEQKDKDEKKKQTNNGGDNDDLQFKVDDKSMVRLLKDKQKVNQKLDVDDTPRKPFWDILH